jgi:hypothetical protein
VRDVLNYKIGLQKIARESRQRLKKRYSFEFFECGKLDRHMTSPRCWSINFISRMSPSETVITFYRPASFNRFFMKACLLLTSKDVILLLLTMSHSVTCFSNFSNFVLTIIFLITYRHDKM